MTKTNLSEFREAVYQKVVWRPGAILDLVDALTVSGWFEYVVSLSEEGPFRRKHSMVYDVQRYGNLNTQRVKALLGR